jgi:tetratricopeptide (TPR) repeat protein
LWERILRLDPAQLSVAINLGAYYIHRGRAREAMRLWTDALSRNPGLTDARIKPCGCGDDSARRWSMIRIIRRREKCFPKCGLGPGRSAPISSALSRFAAQPQQAGWKPACRMQSCPTSSQLSALAQRKLWQHRS